ncbi:hypothetical protein PR001_g31529 [Phytophthora rubi]|uniref:Reverse transcriptase Ty1/copia-type domain-containing protein n=1 Tax=Phytophthora rubi TaxID=129364 RepID=A0A6A3GHS2_9STRA|nr:hypothetical protein PR001_g31529 [Phytophthora rubi]KAE8993406.1 hypothetical protein PR002_g20249 [Phytophthora rubi]KAE8993408.1 hypothetical protein PR002_g20247 [Phytophthora rubi]
MMNCVLLGLSWGPCLIYLDDTIVFTKGGVECYVVDLIGSTGETIPRGPDPEDQDGSIYNECLRHGLSPAGCAQWSGC